MQDDGDVLRELKCLFTRTNILIRRFARCSVDVKIRLFRSYCICFFDIALWNRVKQSVFKKLESAYVKSLKIFLIIISLLVSLVFCWNYRTVQFPHPSTQR